MNLDELARRAGVEWFDYQEQALTAAAAQTSGVQQRRCLYYKTGAGKSVTSLAMVSLWGYDMVEVIAPPSTHQAWEEWGDKLGVEVQAMSHAKFRMKDTRLSRTVPIIVDEFHMLGGHKGQGFRKMQTLAKHLQAPMVLCSATPNYNDAERVYCIESILDPVRTRGGFLEFLYRHCNTRQNPFGQEPLVDEQFPFRNFKDAADYLSSLPNVDYLPDDLVYTIVDVPYWLPVTPEMDRFGYDRRNHRIIASQIEERHTRRFQGLVGEDERLHSHVRKIVYDLTVRAHGPVLVYANHATVAQAAHRTLGGLIITGDDTKKVKEKNLQIFLAGGNQLLIGTASLATGTDGIDKVCDTLIILDDTDDDSLRRQLIGRIMPRGADTDASRKQVYRLVPM